jgi:hypothetical protein
MDKELEDLIKGTKKSFARLDKLIYDSIMEYMLEELSISDNKIRFTQSNIGVINKLDETGKSFGSYLKKLFKYIIDGIGSLLGWSTEQLKKYDVRAEKSGQRVTNRLIEHASKSLAVNLNLSVIFADVKQTAISLLTRPEGIDIKTLRTSMREKVIGNKIAERYYSRWTADIYSQYQRVGANEIRKDIGLRFAIYQGGLIESSRPFCEKRNGEVFHEDEIKSWVNLDFKGKPESGYDPVTDLGGYNCRHRLDWISDELAFSLRPELKEKYEK